ncbi:MAG: methyltransferase domain-containing protein [Deltaproteobacteria bacterium]|nr:methyltransferase domain-containing protein [Nannocystaceae bacterium]
MSNDSLSNSGFLATPAAWDLVAPAYAAELVSQLASYAEDALRLANVEHGARILDVACGPGTLTLLAARRGANVDALDLSPGMIDRLRAALTREQVTGRVEVRLGDGQQLPYAARSYDAAFSMFGLMFFPDRHRGFCELRRCLRDDGTAVVSAWQPIEGNVPFWAGIFTALRAAVPSLSFGRHEAPLSRRDVFVAELSEAGFRDVAVHDVRHRFTTASTADAWAMAQRTIAPLALLARDMGVAWTPIAEQLGADLVAMFGAGPQTITMPAWLGVGRR